MVISVGALTIHPLNSAWAILTLERGVVQPPPVAEAGPDVPNHPPIIEITFDGTGSYHPDPSRKIVKYIWDFGDGSPPEEGSIVKHGFPAFYHPDDTIDWDKTTHDYTVTLTVTDDNSPAKTDSDTCKVHITPPPWPPVADANGPYNASPCQIITLDGSGSYDPNGKLYPDPSHPWHGWLVSWEWDFNNDRIYDNATGQNPVWSSCQLGLHVVGLKVTNNFGISTVVDTLINVVGECGDGVLETYEQCDDGNTANGDCCSSTCKFEPAGSSCSDGQFCTVADTCNGTGTCVGGSPRDCSDGVSCTDDSCNEATDTCVHTPNNAHCPNDGLYCNGTEFCDAVNGCSHSGNPCAGECCETTDTYGQCGQYKMVSLDIHPQSCPNPIDMKSKGVIPAAILGTKEFDVTKIDPTTILLEGVAPIRWAYEDVATPDNPFATKASCYDCNEYGADGWLDLTLKFDTQQLAAAMREVKDRDCVLLTLTGNLKEEFGGGQITGQDIVKILVKMK